MSKHPALHGLYGITDARLLGDEKILLHAVESALRGGMKILQYRDKTLPYRQQHATAQKIRRLCRNHQAIFLVNDDVELAAATQADGVHVGSSDASIACARERLGADAIIGRSCYNRLQLALDAQAEGADYVDFGRFFPSRSKPQAVQAHVEILAQARKTLHIPICAIGGITTDNAGRLIAHGADMVAVIDDLFSSQRPELQAARISALFV